MRIRNSLAVAAFALTPLVTLVTPAHATFQGVAHVVFQGDVTLATFPCSPPATCTANFVATTVAGTAVTTNAPHQYVVIGLSATVTYNEVCVAGEALQGTATGTATLTTVPAHNPPLTIPFQWVRVVTEATITSNPPGNLHPAVRGSATFVPSGGLPACTGGSVTASVTGEATATWAVG